MVSRVAVLASVACVVLTLATGAAWPQPDFPWLPPRLVEVFPEPFATGVDPDIEAIELIFDRPMSTKGWANLVALEWAGVLPVTPGAQPKWDEAGTVCRILVTLAPDITFACAVNDAQARWWKHFVDLDEGSVLPLAWVFSTGDVSEEDLPVHVIDCDPLPGDTNVDCHRTEISVTFSRPVMPGHSNWSPVVDRGEFPTVVGEEPRLSEDRMTATLEVSLKPNTVYALGIVNSSEDCYRDLDGRPVLPFYFAFRTSDATEPVPDQDFRPLDWQVTQAGSFVYHTAPDAEVPLRAIEANNESVRVMGEFLGVEPPERIDVYWCPDVTTLEALTGLAEGPVIDARTIHTLNPEIPRYHLAPMLARALGTPPALLEVGLAAYLGDWEESGRRAPEWAKFLLPIPVAEFRLSDKHEWVPLTALLNRETFERHPSPISHGEAGTWVGWIVDTFGRETLLELYGSTSGGATVEANKAVIAQVLGVSLEESEQRLIDELTPTFTGPIAACGGVAYQPAIIPTAEEDAEAQAAIERYIRGTWKQADVITDEEALALDTLPQIIYCYGTMQGNLVLRKYADQFPFRVEPDRIVADNVYYGTDLRFIAAFPRPDDPTAMITAYTAQQAKDIPGINGVFHGPTDYVVARGRYTVRSGFCTKDGARWSCDPPPPLPFGTLWEHAVQRRALAAAMEWGDSARQREIAARAGKLDIHGVPAYYVYSKADESTRDVGLPAVVLVADLQGHRPSEGLLYIRDLLKEPCIVIWCELDFDQERKALINDPEAWRAKSRLFHELVLEYQRLLNIDPDRTYLTGGGDGATCAWMLAYDHPELYAGLVMPHASAAPAQIQTRLEVGAQVVTVLANSAEQVEMAPYTFSRWLQGGTTRRVQALNPHSRWEVTERDDVREEPNPWPRRIDYVMQFRRGQTEG